MIQATKYIRNSILKYQYGQMKGWAYSVVDNVWFLDGLTADEPDIMDLVFDVQLDYSLLL